MRSFGIRNPAKYRGQLGMNPIEHSFRYQPETASKVSRRRRWRRPDGRGIRISMICFGPKRGGMVPRPKKPKVSRLFSAGQRLQVETGLQAVPDASAIGCPCQRSGSIRYSTPAPDTPGIPGCLGYAERLGSDRVVPENFAFRKSRLPVWMRFEGRGLVHVRRMGPNR